MTAKAFLESMSVEKLHECVMEISKGILDVAKTYVDQVTAKRDARIEALEKRIAELEARK
jgi:hypothetical protein